MKKAAALLLLAFLALCLSGCRQAEVQQSVEPAAPSAEERKQPEEPEAPEEPEESPVVASYIEGKNDFFQPEKPCTRAEIARILYNLGLSMPGGQSFSDVPEDSWYAPAVAQLSGALRGYSDGTFRPERAVTLAELLALLCRVKGVTAPRAAEGEPWYAPVVSAAAEQGWLEGLSQADPAAAASRALTVSLCNRAMNRVPDRAAIDALEGPVFLDVTRDEPYYYDILEAALTHSEDWGQVERRPVAPGFHILDGEAYYVDQDGEICTTPGVLEAEGEYYLVSEENGRILADDAVHVVDGSPVFCTADGTLLRDGFWHNLQFDERGRYTSGDRALDDELEKILTDCAGEDMSQLEKLYACNCFVRMYGYLGRNQAYPKSVKIMPREDAARFARKIIETQKGDCYNFAAVFWFLALRLGFDAEAVVGVVDYAAWGHVPYAHAWVEIPFDGVPYLFDPQIENNNIRYGRSNDVYGAFQVTYGNAPAYYIKN